MKISLSSTFSSLPDPPSTTGMLDLQECLTASKYSIPISDGLEIIGFREAPSFPNLVLESMVLTTMRVVSTNSCRDAS